MKPSESKTCKECGINLTTKDKRAKFCSQKCAAKFNNRSRKTSQPCQYCSTVILGNRNQVYCSYSCARHQQNTDYIQRWKMKKEVGYKGSFGQPSKIIRDYLFEISNSKCMSCGWSKTNESSGKIPLQVHHIDGNAFNCVEENLQLLCPNCHSLTPNFGRLNKTGSRNLRHKQAQP